MSRLLTVLLTLTVVFLTASAVALATGDPSVGAKGMPGAKGTFEFKPEDFMEGQQTWWKDSDGVDPATAGCHLGTDSKGEPNGRMFGEACLPNGLLVESNPGADEVHSQAPVSEMIFFSSFRRLPRSSVTIQRFGAVPAL